MASLTNGLDPSGSTRAGEVWIAGAAMTPFGKFPNSSVRSLSEQAVQAALRDANLKPSDVGLVFFGNAAEGLLDGQEMIRGQVALRNTGLLGSAIVQIENACATSSTAFYLACIAVLSGAVDVALAVGAEKMTNPVKEKSFAALETALDISRKSELEQWCGSQGQVSSGDSASRSLFMDIYARLTTDYMEASGATVQDFAQIAVKSHSNAALNPMAQFRQPVTLEQVLSSRQIVGPLNLLMCAPIGDGAAAVVVCSGERARKQENPLRVRACVLLSGRDRSDGDVGLVSRAASAAYESAELGPSDLDVVEVHDAVAPAELIACEDLRLCAPGDAPKMLREGKTALGGSVPVNPSGGLLSKGHPIGATGCAQIVELADQLRGRCQARQVKGARVALAENSGGFLTNDPAAATITILSV